MSSPMYNPAHKVLTEAVSEVLNDKQSCHLAQL
jgi:hypothetical protein